MEAERHRIYQETKARTLTALDAMEREAWEAWEKSRGPIIRQTDTAPGKGRESPDHHRAGDAAGRGPFFSEAGARHLRPARPADGCGHDGDDRPPGERWRAA